MTRLSLPPIYIHLQFSEDKGAMKEWDSECKEWILTYGSGSNMVNHIEFLTGMVLEMEKEVQEESQQQENKTMKEV